MVFKSKVKQNGDYNLAIINSIINLTNTGEKIQELMAQGKTLEAMDLFNRLLNSLSSQHPVYPYWRYGFDVNTNGKVVVKHIPNNDETVKKYPLHGSMKFKLPKEYSNFESLDTLLKYAYGKQKNIELYINSLKTWIGDTLIHEQKATDKIKIKATIKPPKFPPPEPMKLYMKDGSFAVDYLEIGLKEISGDFIMLDNSQQESAKVIFSLTIKSDLSEAKFSIKVADKFINDVEANLQVRQFLLLAAEGRPFALKMLKEGEVLFEAQEWVIDEWYDENIKDEIRLFKDLLDIQQYYNVHFLLPEYLTEDDLEAINILKLAMDRKYRTGTFKNLNITVANKETLINIIKIADRNPDGTSFEFSEPNPSIDLFSSTITFSKRQSKFENVIVKDLDRLRKKAELMEEGESIKVTLLPASENQNKVYEYYIK